jgi:hypothetical protein
VFTLLNSRNRNRDAGRLRDSLIFPWSFFPHIFRLLFCSVLTLEKRLAVSLCRRRFNLRPCYGSGRCTRDCIYGVRMGATTTFDTRLRNAFLRIISVLFNFSSNSKSNNLSSSSRRRVTLTRLSLHYLRSASASVALDHWLESPDPESRVLTHRLAGNESSNTGSCFGLNLWGGRSEFNERSTLTRGSSIELKIQSNLNSNPNRFEEPLELDGQIIHRPFRFFFLSFPFLLAAQVHYSNPSPSDPSFQILDNPKRCTYRIISILIRLSSSFLSLLIGFLLAVQVRARSPSPSPSPLRKPKTNKILTLDS